MEGTLGLRPSPTALQGLRLIVLSQVRRDSGPAWEEKLLLIFRVGSSLYVKCILYKPTAGNQFSSIVYTQYS